MTERTVTTHTLTVAATCPVDESVLDFYTTEIEVRGGRLVEIEEILEVVADATRAPIYQEALTRELAATLSCKVTTRGRHGTVDTEVVSDFTPET